MTRQRLRESSVKWNMTLSLDSFALKVVKESEELAFSHKAKIVNINIPEKVKNYIEENLAKEISHVKKIYKFDFNLIPDKSLILPEYKTELLNKNKKIIKKIDNLQKIETNLFNKNFKKNRFINQNFKGKNKFKKRYNYQSKSRRNNFVNKKAATY